MGGGMEAHKNVFIEDWRIPRENLKHNFRWTRRNIGIVGFFGIAIPLLVHKGTVREFYLKKACKGRNTKANPTSKRGEMTVPEVLLSTASRCCNHFVE